MEFMKINPNVKLGDKDQEAKLDAKLKKLFESSYRPKNDNAVHYWPGNVGKSKLISALGEQAWPNVTVLRKINPPDLRGFVVPKKD